MLCLAAAAALSIAGALTCWSGNSHQDGSWSGSAGTGDGDSDCALSTAVLVAGIVAMGVVVSWLAARTWWRSCSRRRRLAKVVPVAPAEVAPVVPAEGRIIDGAAGARQHLLLPGLDIQFPLCFLGRSGRSVEEAKEIKSNSRKFWQNTGWKHLEHGRLSSAQRTSADEIARHIQRNLGTDGNAAVQMSSDADAIYVDVLRLLVPCAPHFRGMHIAMAMAMAMVTAERQPAVAKSGQGLRDGETALATPWTVLVTVSIVDGRYREVFRALLEAGAECDTKDEAGVTALMKAAEWGDTEAIVLLLKASAEVNATDKGVETALMIAAALGHTKAARLLLEAGANGVTALMHAASRGHAKAVTLLLEADAEVNGTDKNGGTALIAAAAWGKTEAVRLLLQAGAEVNATDEGGQTALVKAVLGGYTEAARVLMTAGAECGMKDSRGYTALMEGEINATNNDGETALMAAEERGHTEIAALLRAKKAALTAKNDDFAARKEKDAFARLCKKKAEEYGGVEAPDYIAWKAGEDKKELEEKKLLAKKKKEFKNAAKFRAWQAGRKKEVQQEAAAAKKEKMKKKKEAEEKEEEEEEEEEEDEDDEDDMTDEDDMDMDF